MRAVIYYVTGWTLQTKSQVKIFAKDNRQIYFGFVETHFLEANIATEAGLPTTRVAKRKKIQRAMMFCSNKYFNFICFVESTCLHNLTFEMMTAYAHSNLINVVKRHLLDNKHVMVKFRSHCNNDSMYIKSECHKLLE